MPDLFDTAPYSNPTTSKEAAKTIEKDVSRLARQVLECIRAYPRTCHEIEQVTGLSHQTASARVRQLAMEGFIEDSGDKRPTASGRAAIVWRARA